VEAQETEPAEEADSDATEASSAAEAEADTAEAAADTGAALTGEIPEDFPLASRLESAGITTFEKLLDVDDLTELSGIGPAYAEQIQEALDERS
jgi:small subunit ribosomal protein S1